MKKENRKNIINAATTAAIGGITGITTYGLIGGVGLALCGTAIGITALPFTCIGAGVGLIGYGCYSLGKQVNEKDKSNV
jgi:hypothetical protein